MIMMATKKRRDSTQRAVSAKVVRESLGLSWAQHRLRVLIRLSHVKNCPLFLSEVEFLLFEILLFYLNCVEEKK